MRSRTCDSAAAGTPSATSSIAKAAVSVRSDSLAASDERATSSTR
jgi:hypothetical protein